MTKEQETSIRKDIERMIPDLARRNRVKNLDIELILSELYGSN